MSCTPPSCLTSLIMSLGPGILVSRGRLGLPHPLSARASLPRLGLARSATPSRPCYRWVGRHFAVGENSSTGLGPFLHSLHLVRGCLVRHAHGYRQFPRLLGLHLLSPHKGSSCCSVTATIHSLGWHPTAPLPYAALATSPWSHPSVTLSPCIALPRWQMLTPWVLE